eukprot:COSAG01_NODE_864_length_13055_cov_18.442498_13_plen_89_part_00
MRKGWLSCAALLHQHEPALLSAGGKGGESVCFSAIRASSGQGRTPQPQLLRWLLEHGAPPAAKRNDGWVRACARVARPERPEPPTTLR